MRKNTHNGSKLIAYFAIILLFGCQGNSNIDSEEPIIVVQEIKSPTAGESAEPNLHLDRNGGIYISWIEDRKEGHSVLSYANLDDKVWSEPIQIAEGNNWFVNWADFPSITAFAENSLAAHYLVESGGGTYAYDLNITISNDGGKTWNRALVPHSDNTPTEHGFASLLPFKEDHLMAIWLDGRKYADENKEMTLRGAIIDRDGNIIDEYLLDERVCDCCPTDAVSSGDAMIAVYRDRSDNEIRDVSCVRFQNGKWSEPISVSNDNWEISGCPVNGPAIDALGGNVCVAWYTGANEDPKVKVSFSDDLGVSFGAPITVNEKPPLGRVDVVSLKDGAAYVSWMEEDEKETYIKVRKVYKSGAMETAIIVSKTSGKRSSGFPKMVEKGNDLLFAWTVVGEQLKIKTAIVKFNH